MKKRNKSRQEPEPKLCHGRKGKPRLWKTRYWRYLADGTKEHPWEAFGDEVEFRTKSDLKNSPKYKDFIERINNIRVVVFFTDLCRLYTTEEITQRCPHGQTTAKGQLRYLEDKWGKMRLDEFIQSKYDIKAWLQGDLPLRTKPDQQATRQTRKHLRTLLIQMLTYAVDKKYLPFNPFTGTALSVMKGGAMPVDRSEFYITPQQFQWMMQDTETPGHVKMLILIAYTMGLRTSEMLGLQWDDVEFDGGEPRVRVQRSIDGKHINNNTKNKTSKTWVPMCGLLGARLLEYREKYPSPNGWIFESYTGRPIWDDSLREDHLKPALWRMAAKFKLNGVPSGTGFHAFRHAYNALIDEVSGGSVKEIREVQMKLLRQADEATNKRYGKSAPTMRERVRIAHTSVAELALGVENE